MQELRVLLHDPGLNVEVCLVIDRVFGLGLGFTDYWRFFIGLGQNNHSSVYLVLGKKLNSHSSASADFENFNKDLTEDYLQICINHGTLTF